jgi:hypothetical protein
MLGMDPVTLLTSANSITERGPLRRVVPVGALVVLVIGLIVSGAASGHPDVPKVARQPEHLVVVGAGVLVLAVAAGAIFIAPLFGYLSAALQGAAMTGSLLYPLRALLTRRQRRRRDRLALRWQQLQAMSVEQGLSEREKVELYDLDIRLSRIPTGDLRPTTLGNVLLAANEYPMWLYGLDSRVTLPRLLRLVPADALSDLDGQRQDLQFASEMCGALILASAISLGFVFNDGLWWLLLPLGALVLADLSYRNAVTAAVVYGETLRVLYDLYRFQIYDALQVPRPVRSGEEERAGGRAVSGELWRGSDKPRAYVHFHAADTRSRVVPPTDTSKEGNV